MRWVGHLVLLIAIGLAPLLGNPPPSAAEALSAAHPPRRHPLLFGTREAFSPDTSAFVKWNRLLVRFHADEDRAAALCGAGRAALCEPREWSSLVAALKRTRGLRAKLDLVNTAINRHPYVPSRRNWGVRNYWETPFEFLRKNGQCQDYAVTKYLLLRAAGVPAEKLRIVVLRDTALGLDHAVAVAYADGEALMLDNLIRDVVPVESVRNYQPYYSINERGWWLHRGPNARYAAASGSAAN